MNPKPEIIEVGIEDLGPHEHPNEKTAHISQLTFDQPTMKKLKEWCEDPQGFIVFMGRAGCGKTRFCHAYGRYLHEYYTRREERKLFYKNKLYQHTFFKRYPVRS